MGISPAEGGEESKESRMVGRLVRTEGVGEAASDGGGDKSKARSE